MTMTTADSTLYNYPRNLVYAPFNSPLFNKLNFNIQAPPTTYGPNAPQWLKKQTVSSKQEKAAPEKKKIKDDKERM